MIAPDQAVRERAVDANAITLLVEAGAGTGKTTLLVERTLALLRSGVPLARLVLITFTRKAAAEMSGRIRRRLTEHRDEEWARLALRDFPSAQIGTTDSFCRSLLSDFPLEAGVPPGFQVADGIAQEALRAQAWTRHLERCARQGDETYPRLRAAGVQTRALRRLAYGVLANRDLALAAADEPELADLFREVGERMREIESASESCSDPEDRLLRHVRRIATEWRAAQAVPGSAGERLLLAWKSGDRKLLPGRAGAAKAWGGKGGKQRMLEALAALDASLARHIEGRGRRLTSRASRWIAGFREEYQQLKRERGLLDFQDLALATRDLLKRNEPVRRRIAARFDAILMDEVQDTDPLQMEIAFLLAARGPSPGDPLAADLLPGKLFLVGDPKQSIYRFRRADIELYDRARIRLSTKGEVLQVRANFRAAPELIEVTNRVFRNWMKQDPQNAYQAEYVDLEPLRESAAPREPRVSLLLPDPAVERRLLERTQRERLTAPLRAEAEVDAVTRAVRHILGLADGAPPWSVQDPRSGVIRPARAGDIAVLVRRIAWGDALAEALRGLRIPVSVGAGKRFYAREEIATLLALLRAIVRTDDDFATFAALRSAACGLPDDALVLHYLGEPCPAGLPDPREPLSLFPALRRSARARSLSDFLEEAAEQLSLNAVFGFRSDGPARIEALRMLLEAAESLEEAGVDHLPGFVRWLSEQSAEERADDLGETEPEGRAGVRVLSIHKAKGLEFPIVILADLGTGTPRERLLVADRRSGRVEFRLSAAHGIETAGYAAAAEKERERERAEEVRLLYVAMTRARERLLLSWPAAESGILAAEPLASALGCRPGEAPPADSGLGVLPAAAFPPVADGGGLSRVSLEKALRLAERAAARELPDPWPASRAQASRAPRIRAVTTLPRAHGPVPTRALPVEAEAGPEFGTLVHRALELYEPGESEGASRAVARAAPLVTRALSRERGRPVSLCADLLARATATVGRAVRDAAFAPLWNARRLLREVPFLLPCGENFLSGKIDAIVENERGDLTIYDYKAGRWEASRRPEWERAHRTQALVYGLAVAEITKRPVHGVRILALAAEPVEEIVFPVNAEFLAEARSFVASVT